MEVKLWKSAKYGFISGLALSILFVPYKTTIRTGNNSTVTTYTNLQDYVVTLLRYSIVFAIIVILLVAALEIYKEIKKRS